MSTLTILADENIPYAREAFGTLGDVRLASGRQIGPRDLADVDILVVRSITPVNAALLEGSRVRFVGTATSGADHIATADLDRLGVACYTALGCNANAVAEYMATAWLTLAQRRRCTLRGTRVGVIGVGHVGSRVVEKALALGMEPVLNDPPKGRDTGLETYRPLDELLDCDIVTCHAPLTYDGGDRTYHLIDDRFFSRLKPGAWFCNAGRGEVVDEQALHRVLDTERLGAAILDVWEHEPRIDVRLLRRADLATPHIAGHSLEGKLNGTRLVYEAVCQFLGVHPSWRADDAGVAPRVPTLALHQAGRDDEAVLAEVAHAVYPILHDDEALRETAALGAEARGRAFDSLRRTYAARHEFGRTAVTVEACSPTVGETLRALGFAVRAVSG